MSNHRSRPTDDARDQLFSHIQRCGVLQATKEDQDEWLRDTMDYLAAQNPELSEQQLAAVELMGRRYLEPRVPHGAGTHAGNRDEWQTGSEPRSGVQGESAANP